MTPHVHVVADTLDGKPHIQLVTVKGQIDESNLSVLEDYLNPIIVNDTMQVLIFNFKELEFINSRVIGYLLTVYSSMAEADKRLAIVESNDQIMSILSLVGLTTLISHYGRLDEALEVME